MSSSIHLYAQGKEVAHGDLPRLWELGSDGFFTNLEPITFSEAEEDYLLDELAAYTEDGLACICVAFLEEPQLVLAGQQVSFKARSFRQAAREPCSRDMLRRASHVGLKKRSIR